MGVAPRRPASVPRSCGPARSAPGGPGTAGPGRSAHRRRRRAPVHARWTLALALDDRGDALAAPDAERDERRAEVAPLELVERGAEQHRSRRPERMAERDRPAVHVDAG